MYRSTHRPLFALLLLCATCLGPSSLFATQETQGDIVVPEGTAINVVTAHDVTSKEAKPNDPVNFTVNEDLVINGQVIVKKGTPAIGSVINAEKGGYLGKAGKLGIQVESTQTVDGQPLKLRAAKGREGDDKTMSTFVLSSILPAFLFRKGGEARVVAGTPVTVYVAAEKRFRVDGGNLVAVASETPAAGDVADATVYIYRPKKMEVERLSLQCSSTISNSRAWTMAATSLYG